LNTTLVAEKSVGQPLRLPTTAGDAPALQTDPALTKIVGQPLRLPTTAGDAPALQTATLNEWTWKTPAMKAMTLAVCRLALARGIAGKFSANDLDTVLYKTADGRVDYAHNKAEKHGGTGIAGSVFGQLVRAGIIAPVGVLLNDGAFFQERVRNAGGNPVGVWRLRHPGLCQALIRVHAPAEVKEPVQEMFNLPPRSVMECAGLTAPFPGPGLEQRQGCVKPQHSTVPA